MLTTSQDSPTNSRRDAVDFDLVVLGATGLTGRLVVEQLLTIDPSLRSVQGARRWAVAGRDPAGLANVLTALDAADVEIITADLTDQASLERLAARTVVVLNLAGPYTKEAEQLIAACVKSGTSYVDLSGELPLLRRVIDRFDEPARRAGVQIVQMAGWEAMPADWTTLLACQRAAASEATPIVPGDGPGAADPIARVEAVVHFSRLPTGGVPLSQAVSGGTLASLVAMLEDPGAALIGVTGGLLPQFKRGPQPGPLRLPPRPVRGRVLGPAVPVAFLNPPIVNRTAALLAAERGVAYQPATFVEGVDLGPTGGLRGAWRRGQAALQGRFQRALVLMTRLPLSVRGWLATGLRRRLPRAGTGPADHYLRDWAWTVEARATTRGGTVGVATLTGIGHPGYTATAALLVEVGLSIVHGDTNRSGCLTPALALGTALSHHPRLPSLSIQ
ncbi:saccharopine dehydrogenase NADP-binding domain-containing protein [soil metagenome]